MIGERRFAGRPRGALHDRLEYLGIGYEEWGQGFKERFTAFFRAIKASHPEIKVVGTAGPYANDFDNLWAFNRQLGVDIVDEHYYKRSEWFYENTGRYDGYERNGPKVFVGEFASSSSTSKNNDLASALAEAAYMTGMERNGDLIYFDHFRIYGTPSYYVQRLFSANPGDTRLPVTDFSYKPGKAAVSRGAAAAPGLFTCGHAGKRRDSRRKSVPLHRTCALAERHPGVGRTVSGPNASAGAGADCAVLSSRAPAARRGCE